MYVATARLQLDGVEGAAQIMRPVFDLPAEDRISWLVKRAGRIGSMLSAKRYAGSPTATALREDIAALAG